MGSILVNQNKPENIKCLAAMRQLYSEGKTLVMLQLVLTIPVTIILSLLKLVPKETLGFDIAPYAALYAVLVLVLDLYVVNYLTGQKRTDAARIQELFDCEVYGMGWSSFFAGKKPDRELVNKKSSEYTDRPDAPLQDWYPTEIEQLPHEQAILVCQRTNLYYDSSLRRRYRLIIIWLAAVSLFLMLLDALITGLGIAEFFILIVVPFLPVFSVTQKIMADHSKSIKAATDLHQAVAALEAAGEAPSMEKLREIQSKIYCHRKDSPLIPDFFYYKRRDKHEKEMHENALLK